MGREIKRVPMDFDFPLGKGYFDHQWAKHTATCEADEHDDCEVDTEPPKGDGWQLWQTVSDGPISPVFATADELVDWMCQPVPLNERRPFAPEAYPAMPWARGWRREVAEPFVKRCGWAPSMVISGGVAMSGPEAMVRAKAEEK